MIEGTQSRKTGERERERESSKYLQLTDLSKWITCPVSLGGGWREGMHGMEDGDGREMRLRLHLEQIV